MVSRRRDSCFRPNPSELTDWIRVQKGSAASDREPPLPNADQDYLFSDRKREILRGAAQGRTNAEIADELFLSASTIKRHLEDIYGKLGVSGRTAAVVKAIELGEI
jgi:DNA-binding NarL/FixJ family response regulator